MPVPDYTESGSDRTACLSSCSGTCGLRRMGRGRPGALLARRTRTIRMCSFDARSKGQPWPFPPQREIERIGIFSLDVRSGRLIQATFIEEIRASWEGASCMLAACHFDGIVSCSIGTWQTPGRSMIMLGKLHGYWRKAHEESEW